MVTIADIYTRVVHTVRDRCGSVALNGGVCNEWLAHEIPRHHRAGLDTQLLNDVASSTGSITIVSDDW